MLTTAVAAAQIISKATTALNAARERAKGSKDTDLKIHINTLYDEFLNLKELLIRLTDENSEQRHKIAELEKPVAKPELRQVGTANYYFVGDVGPYCQACYDVGPERRLIRLSPPREHAGLVRRHCVVCQQYFTEKSDDEPAFGIANGPNGWMGR